MNPQGQTVSPVATVDQSNQLFDEKGKIIQKESLLQQHCTNLCVRGRFTSPPPTVNFQLLICWETSYLAALNSLSFQFLFISFSKLLWQIVLHVGGCMNKIPLLSRHNNLGCATGSAGCIDSWFSLWWHSGSGSFSSHLLSCHILKEHVRPHPEGQAA